MIFAANNISLAHLGTVRAGYEPKDISAEAIQVTSENIGALSLEFEVELSYNREGGKPCFLINVARPTDDRPDRWATIGLGVGDWIVTLRGELHVFRDLDFVNTFEIYRELQDPTLYETTLVAEENLFPEHKGAALIADA